MKNFFSKFIILVIALTIGVTTQASAAPPSVAYKDADKSGKVLTELRLSFEESIDAGNLELIDISYDDYSAAIKKTERAIGKVSGKTNRRALLEKYVTPAKIARERVIYEVSQLRLLHIILGLQSSNQFAEAEAAFQKLERLKKRAVEIKEAGGYEQLPVEVALTLDYYEETVVEIFEAYKSGDQLKLLINLLSTYGYLNSSSPNEYFMLGANPEVENGFWLGYQSPTYGDDVFMATLKSFDGTKATYEYDLTWDDSDEIRTGEIFFENGVITLHFVDFEGNDVAVEFTLY
ncbi:hypothetical protein [Metabacillus litoralis]|uniref:hypothetical protein n=1 Tax=Metabacillus litoralis TaxID=152268 RepID=UPI000EF58684|nr:hypothetical protein [Metabacillus litoralis]